MSVEEKQKIRKNWFEWSVFAVGLVLVVGTLAYLAYDGATLGDAPPTVEVRLGTPRQGSHNFLVPITVINHGDKTAEGVAIEVTLEDGSPTPERGELTFAFLPRQASREGFVTFQTDPRNAQLKTRVLGYEEP
ncbi:MAG TPA: hypothetical protein VF666_20130 [Pyrinomonadaceae bacterium]|jgi:uncharacterized protein (TIGR02588 family)